MGAALPVADAAVVLLDRVAMAGQPGAFRPGPVGTPSTARSPAGSDASDRRRRGRGRDRRPGRVRDDRIEQLDLDADDRVDAAASTALANRTAP